jgi:hypothetical protein
MSEEKNQKELYEDDESDGVMDETLEDKDDDGMAHSQVGGSAAGGNLGS